MHQVAYLRRRRAAGLLATTEKTIEAIALEIVYHNLFVFSNPASSTLLLGLSEKALFPFLRKRALCKNPDYPSPDLTPPCSR
jgi:hypothetical protein